MQFVKEFILSSLPIPLKGIRAIFTYHDISSASSPQYSAEYSTSPNVFQEQIRFLQKKFHIVSLSELIANKMTDKNMAAITFDDGFFSVKEEAHPFLKKENIPYAIFVNKIAVLENKMIYANGYEHLNKKYSTKIYLDTADLQQLSMDGVLIGSHGTNHKVLSDCSLQELREEIFDNNDFLKKILDKKIDHFAIPFGKKKHFNQAALDLLINEAGQCVYSSSPALVENQQVIPRISLLSEDSRKLAFYINRARFRKVDL